MSDFLVLDPRFEKLIIGHAKLEQLWTGTRWTEGPAYFAAGSYLIFSDIPNDRIMRYDETRSGVSVFREPARNTNGHTVDTQGRLVSFEHRGRGVSRTEHNGRVVMLATHFEGKRLNSPNDVVVKSDGSIWFTDPTYGIDSEYEGDAAPSEIGASNVYRLGGDAGVVTAVASDRVQPKGSNVALRNIPKHTWIVVRWRQIVRSNGFPRRWCSFCHLPCCSCCGPP